MRYGLKYIMQWASRNANANDYRIELYQKDYSGDTTVKKLGSAPSLVIDNADNGIMGTSLQFSIQADTDGELQELYTTDAKKFKCLLFKNDKQIWAGYLLQELYSEDYIAAPYDVGVTATDQLALLKDVPYAPIGRKTLLEIIHNAITPTQLELGYSVQTSLKPQLQDSNIPFISFVTIEDGGYINFSCYEVISMIMRTCNMTITQIENSWVIARKSDISAEIFSYDSALNLIGQAEPNALVIGRMYENDIWPVGNLVRKFTAVPKTLKVAFSPIVKSSFFDNPTMEGREYWQINGTYIDQAPGKYKVTVNRIEYNYNVNAWILRSSNRKTKDFALWQSIDVEQGGASLSLKMSYCPMRIFGLDTNFSKKLVSEAKLTVQIKLEADSEEIYYLTKEGWKLEDAGDLAYTANPINGDLRQRGNKDLYSSAVINFPAIPANGVLTISFRNDSVHYIKSDASNMEPYYEPYYMGVTDVMLTAPDVVGYDSDVILNAQGNSSVEQELFFSDAYGIGNEEKSLYNFIRIGDSDTSDWLLGKSTFETFFKAMVQDTANLASLKNHYSGVISGTLQIGLLYYEKFSGDILRMERGTLDLLTEDLNGEWLQVPISDAVYDEIELNTNENNVVKPASVSTSIPTGNFASTDALDALTKIVNILDSIIGLDEDDEAYVKPKSDGSARNFYSLGEVSSGGKNGEGDGTGTTSLYDIPEIAVSVATLADGQSLVYDAVSSKWVNRLVQGASGSGVDMADVWAALAGATNEKINASHIPDLSDVYLPLTGGYMHGNVYFDAGKGIMASNSSATIQIGMYQNNGIFLQGPALYYTPASGTDYHIWHEGNLPDTTWVKNSGGIKATDTYLRHAGYGYNADGWGTTGPAIAFGASNGYTMLMQQGASSYDVKVSYKTPDGTIRDWKTVAFTDEPSFAKYLGSFNGDANTIDDGFIGGKLFGAANFPYNYYSFISAGYGNYKLQFNGYNNYLQFRCGSESGLEDKAWRVVAFTDSNVASATKLQTARKIWGNSFDGTGGIDGNLVLNNHISIRAKLADGSTNYDLLYLSPGNNFQIGYGAAIVGKLKTYLHGYGIDFRSKGTDGATMSLTTDGNVGIGITTPEYKLDVNGAIRTNSYITFGVTGVNINADITSSFRASIFGDTQNRSALRTFRTNNAAIPYLPAYAASLAWASADTHAFVSVDYTNNKSIYFGAGNANSLVWTAKIFHNKASLYLDAEFDNKLQIGSPNARWSALYAYAGNFVNGVRTNYFYNQDATRLVFQATTDWMAIGGSYRANGCRVVLEGSPIYLRGSGGNDLTISSEGIATFTKMSHHNEGIKIGEATLVWDAENQCLVVDKDFAGLGEISSGGISSVIGSGGVFEEDVTFSGNVAFNGPVKINQGLVLNSGLQVGNETDYKSMAVYGSVDIYSKLWLKNNLATGEVSERWAIINFSDDGYVEFDHSIRCISLVQTSDITLKQIIEDVCLFPTKVIANAPLFKFTWKNSADRAVHIGTSAQYWLDYAPELTALYDSKYTLDYATLGVLMGKSNASEIEQLKKEVKELKNEVTRLKGGNYAV